MKTLIFLIVCFLSTIPVFAQKKLTEVDLRVNGIHSGSQFSAVLRKFGRPSSVKHLGFDECGRGLRKVLHYPGLAIGLLGDGKGRKYQVISIGLTSSKWTVSPGIRIGAGKDLVQSRYGQPNEGSYPGQDVLDYVTKENLGGVTFYFKNGRLIRVLMMETLC